MRLVAIALAALVATVACASGAPSARRSVPTPPPTPAIPDWPTYHGNGARTGVAAGAAVMGTPQIAFESDPIDGDVYASPIVAGGLVVLATEANSVYAFDGRSGRAAWHVNLGEPVDASTLPCGDIRPVSGITSTPVADPARGTVWVVAFLKPAHHVLFALDLVSGRVRDQRAVDPPGESPLTHQQRGALALTAGRVLIPYGGLLGDCGTYHGWLVAAPVEGGDLLSYRVPCGRACGLWAPGGPTVADDGTIWIASGNSDSRSVFDHGNAAIALAPDLHELGSFAPAEWAQMNAADADLGSISPVVLDARHVYTSGKTATGWIIDAARPGGVGGQLFAGSTGCGTFSGTAWLPPTLYIACQGAVEAVTVDLAAPSFKVTWRQPHQRPGAPIVAGGALWVVDTADGQLFALDLATGAARAQLAVGEVMHFVTPAAAAGLVYVAGDRRLRAVALAGAR